MAELELLLTDMIGRPGGIIRARTGQGPTCGEDELTDDEEETPLNKHTVAELRDLLQGLGLNSKGLKDVLVERLEGHQAAGTESDDGDVGDNPVARGAEFHRSIERQGLPSVGKVAVAPEPERAQPGDEVTAAAAPEPAREAASEPAAVPVAGQEVRPCRGDSPLSPPLP